MATVTIRDGAGASTNSISFGGTFTVRAVVVDATGAPVSGRVVTFAITGAPIATLPNPATALTDSAGLAAVSISPSSVSASGATSVSATASVGGANVVGQTDFAVATSNLSLSPISVGSNSLPSGGNTSASVTAQLNGSPFTGSPVNITFSVSCGRINGASGSFGTTTDGNGVASVTYTAVQADGSLCSGGVTFSATTPGATPRTTTLTVAPPTANAVTFVSATPAQIFIAGSGAAEQSVVKFKVLSSAGTPLGNVGVTFSIVVNPGGVGIGSAGSTTPVNGSSDSNGEVSVAVFSGSIPGPVRVRAALSSNTGVFAESQNLTVASGPPSQRFMSVSLSSFNIEGWKIDGTPTTVSVRLADRQGNPVDDGTVVNFTAEGGQVAQSCATAKVNGISGCSVTFISQNPRPTGGRSSVLAFTNGTKDYTDANGNNRYDPGTDALMNIGDAYRDDNENGQYDSGEFVLPRGGSVACAGSGEPFPGRANTCVSASAPDALLTTVRQQVVVLFSSSTPLIEERPQSAGGFSFRLRSSDNRLLPMPVGTSVGATASSTIPGSSCGVTEVLGTSVTNIDPTTNPLADLSTPHSVSLRGCVSGDRLTVSIGAPSGLTTTFAYTLP